MKQLLKLAEKIEDKGLREKVVELLEDPKLTNKAFDYKPADRKKLPSSLNFHHIYEGGNLDHVKTVVELCIKTAEILKENYDMEIDMDALIAAALVHDVGKLFELQQMGDKTWNHTGMTLDHTVLGTAELYSRGFPEKVVHIVASHFGLQGPTPPQTAEAVILHYVDSMDASLNASTQEDLLQLLMG